MDKFVLHFCSSVCREMLAVNHVTPLERWVRTGGWTLATNVGRVCLQTKDSGTVTGALFFISPLSFF